MKNEKQTDGSLFLKASFSCEQKLLQTKLDFSNQSISHAVTKGTVNEDHFISILRKYLPNRYAIDTGIILDSTGSTSDQIDVVVYDRQYTPTLLDQKEHRYIPAEAVYAIFEVKPSINKQHLDYAGNKAKSVRLLKRTSIPITHAGGEFPAKELFPVIAGIVASRIEWSDGFNALAFNTNHSTLTEEKYLDCGLAVSGACFDFFDGKLKTGPSGNALAFFLFRLLQKLQSLGTVPAIDWNLYGEALGS